MAQRLQAALECPICFNTFSSRMKVMSCGHMLCEGCMGELQNQREHKGKCPLCKATYKKDTYTIFPELHVVDAISTDEILQRTRQRVVHVTNLLGVMSSAEDIRDAYNTAREHRAGIRNMATGCKDPDFETLTVAVTDAVDALEERLHYSLQKQDLANSIMDMKKKLKSEAMAHEVERAALVSEMAQLRQRHRHEEKERAKATAALDTHKQLLNAALMEQSQQTKRSEQQGTQVKALQAELNQTRTERSNFQAQLEEYRKKTIKQRALVSQLKKAVEELKSKSVLHQSVHKTPPAHPYPPEWPTLVPSPGFIDLCSSSPTSASFQPGVGRKRSRAQGENQHRSTSDAALLPPPKVRVGGPSKPRAEVVENVSVHSNGEIRRLVADVPGPAKAVARNANGMAHPTLKKRPAEPQLALGQGGKLVAAVKKRKVRAV